MKYALCNNIIIGDNSWKHGPPTQYSAKVRLFNIFIGTYKITD